MLTLFKTSVYDMPLACLTDLTPPTFAGITSVTPQSNGSLLVQFPQATDTSTPLRYRVYIALGSVDASNLFQSTNIVQVVEPQGVGPYFAKIFTLSDQVTFLAINETYTLGVRAVDAVGITETNTVILTAVSFGVIPDNLNSVYSNIVSEVDTLETIVNDLEVIVFGAADRSSEIKGLIDSEENLIGIIED